MTKIILLAFCIFSLFSCDNTTEIIDVETPRYAPSCSLKFQLESVKARRYPTAAAVQREV